MEVGKIELQRVPPGFVDLTVGLLSWLDRVKVSRKPPEAFELIKMLEEGAGEPAPESRNQEPKIMAAPRDKLQREVDLQKVLKMRLMDVTMEEIAAEIGVSVSTVHNDCQELLKRYREDNGKEFNEAKNEELDRLIAWRAECLAQYRLTKDVRWLEQARKIEEMILKIYGVNAPEKHELTTKTALDELLEMPDREREKAAAQIEERIGKAEGTSPGSGEGKGS